MENTPLEDLKQKVKEHYILTVGEEVWYRMIGEKVDILRRIKEELEAIAPNTTEEIFRKSVFESVLEDCENEGQQLINIAVYETALDVFNLWE